MVTVAEAAAALGIDERTVREKLSKEEWKGEKRMIGMKEKWFMHRGELDRQVERLRIMRPQERVSTHGMESVFESEETIDTQTVDAQSVEVQSGNQTSEKISIAIDDVLTKLTEQFSRQLHAEKEVIFTLKKELEEKDRQLRLLPDLQKRAEEERQAAELKELEAEALRKQIVAMEAEQQQAAESRRTAEEEIARLTEEKEAQAKAVQEQLQALSATVQELKNPWWKKWFSSPRE
jgi:DNA repair exonuclease SbcCD ATPase subunit